VAWGARLEMARDSGFTIELCVGELRTLWSAYAVSVCGDQLAEAALSVLVFNRTRFTRVGRPHLRRDFLSDLLGGPLLAGLADLFPRKSS
jgi:hypothetical protein